MPAGGRLTATAALSAGGQPCICAVCNPSCRSANGRTMAASPASSGASNIPLRPRDAAMNRQRRGQLRAPVPPAPRAEDAHRRPSAEGTRRSAAGAAAPTRGRRIALPRDFRTRQTESERAKGRLHSRRQCRDCHVEPQRAQVCTGQPVVSRRVSPCRAMSGWPGSPEKSDARAGFAPPSGASPFGTAPMRGSLAWPPGARATSTNRPGLPVGRPRPVQTF